jgi:hypothetical protein
MIPVNSGFTAAEALTRPANAAAGAGRGPGNLFGAAARGLGLSGTAGQALTALGPAASLLGGGLNVYEGLSSMSEDGVGIRNSLQTTGGVAGLIGGAGGIAAMAGASTGAAGLLAAAGPYGAAAAAGIGLGLRGDSFMEEHLGMGVGDIVMGFGNTTSGWAESLGAEEGGFLSTAAGMAGAGVGGIVGGVGAVGAGILGVGQDIGNFVGSWF